MSSPVIVPEPTQLLPNKLPSNTTANVPNDRWSVWVPNPMLSVNFPSTHQMSNYNCCKGISSPSPRSTRWGSIHNGISAEKGTNTLQLQWSLEQETSARQSQVEF
jgi:hypothetical protein